MSGYTIGLRLHTLFANTAPGVGLTMDEILEGLGERDPQRIRQALVDVRKGKVHNPATREKLRPLPVVWNSRNKRYYNLAAASSDMVERQIPGQILTRLVNELLTRVLTIGSAMGEDGIVRAAHMLEDRDVRNLLLQVPYNELHRVTQQTLELSNARQLLEIEGRRGT